MLQSCKYVFASRFYQEYISPGINRVLFLSLSPSLFFSLSSVCGRNTHSSGGGGDSMVGANPNEDSLSTPATADRRKVNEQVPLVCAPPTLSTPLLVLHTRLPEPAPFFSLSLLARSWWKIAWKNGRRARQIIRFPPRSFPTDLSPFLQTRPVTTVLGCIRKANVIIHARILGVPLRHVWEPVALRVVVS